jgi:hypothetical protein
MTVSLERRLRSELQRDSTEIVADVERNLEAVEARAARPSGRVYSPLLLVASAAIVLLIAFRFGGQPSVGVSPITPPPSASPSASAVSGPVCPIGRGSCRGPLQPGTYRSRSFNPAVTFTVADGWENTLDQGHQLDLSYTAGGQYTYPDGTTFHDGISIFAGPIAESGTTINAVPGVGSSAHELALWLSAHADLIASGLSPVTLGRVSGYRISLSLPTGPRTAPDHCTADHGEPRCESLFVGDPSGGWYGFGLVGPETTVVYLLDTSPGVTVMVVIDDVDGVDAAGLSAAAMPVVQSLTFAVPAGASPKP